MATVVAAELPVVLLWLAVILITGLAPAEQLRWLALAFIAPTLLLRRMAKRQQAPTATKGAIVTLFVTFMVFIVFYLKTK